MVMVFILVQSPGRWSGKGRGEPSTPARNRSGHHRLTVGSSLLELLQVTSCKGYAHWRARQAGDMLPEDVAKRLELLSLFCAMEVAIRDGLELLLELPP